MHFDLLLLILLKLIEMLRSLQKVLKNLQDDQRSHDAKYPGDGGSGELIDHLPPISVYHTHGLARPQIVDFFGGEDPREDSSDGSTDSVDPESVERVIIAELLFGLGYHEVANHAGCHADQNCGNGLDEAISFDWSQIGLA